MKLDAYTVVFLRRPADAPVMSNEDLDALQQKHLAFNAGLRKSGQIVTNGPLIGQPDSSLRGISIYRTSVEETRRLAQEALRAGGQVDDRGVHLADAGGNPGRSSGVNH